MEDISEELFVSFAYGYVKNKVINDNDLIKLFSQDEKQVIIETERKKLIFTMCHDMYQLQYIKDEDGLYMVYSGADMTDYLDANNSPMENINLVIFEKLDGNKLHLTHVDLCFEKVTPVMITVHDLS